MGKSKKPYNVYLIGEYYICDDVWLEACCGIIPLKGSVASSKEKRAVEKRIEENIKEGIYRDIYSTRPRQTEPEGLCDGP